MDKTLQMHNHRDGNKIDILLGQESKIPYNTTEESEGYFTIFSTQFDTPVKTAPASIYKRTRQSKGAGKQTTKSKGNSTGKHLGVFISAKSWQKPYIKDFKQLDPWIIYYIYTRLATRSLEITFLRILAPHSRKPDDERKQLYDTLE